MTKQNENVFINIFDTDIFNAEISKTIWVNNEPTSLEFTQLIRVGTSSSSYQTNIPITHTSEYIITTYERPNYEIKNYKFVVDKSTLLGQIYERETYTEDTKYLMQNKLYAKVLGSATLYLEVQKVGATSSLIINQDNSSLSDVQNLINSYNYAIDYLLSSTKNAHVRNCGAYSFSLGRICLAKNSSSRVRSARFFPNKGLKPRGLRKLHVRGYSWLFF